LLIYDIFLSLSKNILFSHPLTFQFPKKILQKTGKQKILKIFSNLFFHIDLFKINNDFIRFLIDDFYSFFD
ncbi:hypothetical protein BWK60_08300, partial [Flavobacterium covae]